jgi:hypothetical protein
LIAKSKRLKTAYLVEAEMIGWLHAHRIKRAGPSRSGERGRTYTESVWFKHKEIISLGGVRSGWLQLGSILKLD